MSVNVEIDDGLPSGRGETPPEGAWLKGAEGRKATAIRERDRKRKAVLDRLPGNAKQIRDRLVHADPRWATGMEAVLGDLAEAGLAYNRDGFWCAGPNPNPSPATRPSNRAEPTPVPDDGDSRSRILAVADAQFRSGMDLCGRAMLRMSIGDGLAIVNRLADEGELEREARGTRFRRPATLSAGPSTGQPATSARAEALVERHRAVPPDPGAPAGRELDAATADDGEGLAPRLEARSAAAPVDAIGFDSHDPPVTSSDPHVDPEPGRGGNGAPDAPHVDNEEVPDALVATAGGEGVRSPPVQANIRRQVLEDLAAHPRSAVSSIAARLDLRADQVSHALAAMGARDWVVCIGRAQGARWLVARPGLAQLKLERAIPLPPPDAVSAWIVAGRRARGLTQRELGDKAGLAAAQAVVSAMERGARHTEENIARLEVILGPCPPSPPTSAAEPSKEGPSARSADDDPGCPDLPAVALSASSAVEERTRAVEMPARANLGDAAQLETPSADGRSGPDPSPRGSATEAEPTAREPETPGSHPGPAGAVESCPSPAVLESPAPARVEAPGGERQRGGSPDLELELELANRFEAAVEAPAPVLVGPPDPANSLFDKVVELHGEVDELEVDLKERDREISWLKVERMEALQKLDAVGESLDRMRIPGGHLLWRLGFMEGRLGPQTTEGT